jgi:hypothetical protein
MRDFIESGYESGYEDMPLYKELMNRMEQKVSDLEKQPKYKYAFRERMGR